MATLNLSTTISFYMGNTSLCSIFFILIQVGLFMIHRLGCTRGVCRWNHAECYSDLCEKVNLTPSWTGAAFIYLGYIISTSPRAVLQGRQRKNMSKHLLSLKFGWAVFTHPWTPHPQDLNAQTNNGIKSQTCYFQDRFVTQLQFRDFNRLGDN